VNVDTDKPKLASEVQTSNNVILGTVGTMKLSDFDPADVAKGKAYIEKVLGNEEDVSGIKTYLKKAYDKYSTLKTLMYRDEPKPFYSFYVCNNVTQRIYISRRYMES
jgi:predicted component of type VI protein secretion system